MITCSRAHELTKWNECPVGYIWLFVYDQILEV